MDRTNVRLGLLGPRLLLLALFLPELFLCRLFLFRAQLPGLAPSMTVAAAQVAESPQPASPQPASPTRQRFQRTEPHMGTVFGIVFYSDKADTANHAFAAAFARVAALNRVCSDYDLDSELSRLSAQAPTAQPVEVSADLMNVLAAAQDLSTRSEGAFDVTVGPLTKLWRRARMQKKPPAEERIREALQAVGYRALEVDPIRRTVQLHRPGMRLDLGAIAKGYAVDEALATLRRLGITQALVNAGGNLAIGDPPPGEPGWRVDIAPLERGAAPTDAIIVANVGVATSGDLYQYFDFQGQRYSHILDPRTGWGLAQRRSVTVVARSGMAADGLATAVSVLGLRAGMKLIDDTPCAALRFAESGPRGVTVEHSARFPSRPPVPEP